MKSVIYEFDPVIYPFPLLVTKKYDSKELSELFYVVNTDNELEDKPDEFCPNTNTVARTIEVVSKTTNNRFYLVMLCRPSVIGVGTISHEAYHAMNMIASLCGFLPERQQDDEPCAYLVQWIANCIDSVLKGKPERMEGIIVKEKEQ